MDWTNGPLTFEGPAANHVGRPKAGASITRDIVRKSLLGIALLVVVAAACTAAPAADFPISPLPSLSPTPSPSPQPIVQMPDVTGLAYADAADVLHARGFKVKKERKYSASTPPQRVLKQSRKVGSIVPEGSVVTLTIAIPIPPPINGNPWGYNWGCCNKILDPPADFCSFFACVATFYNGTSFVVECRDGLFSATGGSKQTCSSHDGHKRTLLMP
jgi:PASTA domain